jgi:amidase
LSEYERDGVGGEALVQTGVVPKNFSRAELWALSMFAWDDFLNANADPKLHALADVEGKLIFPHPTGAAPDPSHQRNIAINLAEYARLAREEGITPLDRIPDLAEGLRGLERFRQERFDAWLAESGLDALVFPTVADIAPADADVNPASQAIAWRNGTWVANGNLVLRHLGIPTVTVPMGVLPDIGMPIGLTFAAKPYDDTKLLSYGYAFEQTGTWRQAPGRTPPLPSDAFAADRSVAPSRRQAAPPSLALAASVINPSGDSAELLVEGETSAPELRLFINGAPVEVSRGGSRFTARRRVVTQEHRPRHSEWRGPYGHIVVAVATADAALPIAKYVVVDGVA